jgi:hypothetical protein
MLKILFSIELIINWKEEKVFRQQQDNDTVNH